MRGFFSTWILAAGAAVLCATAWPAGPLFGADAVGRVISVINKVEIKSAGVEIWKTIAVKDNVYQGDTIRTGRDAKAVIFFTDETIITIGPQATIRIDKLAVSSSGKQREGAMYLLIGKVRFNVKRLFSPPSKFEVTTPTTIAGVKGTQFIVWVISADLTRTAVIEGVVAVRNSAGGVGGERLLHRNTFTDIGRNAPPTEPQPMGGTVFQDVRQDVTLFPGTGGGHGSDLILPGSEPAPTPHRKEGGGGSGGGAGGGAGGATGGSESPPENPQTVIITQPQVPESLPSLPRPPGPPGG